MFLKIVGRSNLCSLYLRILEIGALLKVQPFQESGLVRQGIRNRIGRFPVPTSLGTQSGLATQPCYKTLLTLRLKLL